MSYKKEPNKNLYLVFFGFYRKFVYICIMKNTVLNDKDSILWEKYKDYIYRQEEKSDEQKVFNALIEANRDQINSDVGKGWYTEGYNGWSCGKSPVKVCVYNNDFDSEDHYHEDCCYCGQPEERK